MAESVDRDLLETLRAEALGLFQANQTARSAASRTFAAFLAVGGAALAAGVNADTAVVILPVPAVLLLLLAHMFEQYSDLTVIGMARLELEEKVNEMLNGKGLIYESAVVPIRKRPPLVLSFRSLQAMAPLIVLIVVAAGTVAAAGEPALVLLAYAAGTLLAGVVAGFSYWQMLRTPAIARPQIAASLS